MRASLGLLLAATLLAACGQTSPTPLAENQRLGRFMTERHARYLRELPTGGVSFDNLAWAPSEQLNAPKVDRVQFTCGARRRGNQDFEYIVHLRDGRTVDKSTLFTCSGLIQKADVNLANPANVIVMTEGHERSEPYSDFQAGKLFDATHEAIRKAAWELEKDHQPSVPRPSQSQTNRSWQ